MHSAGQAHTSSRTLDLVPGSTTQQARRSNSSPSTALSSDRAAGALAAPAEASTADVAHAVSDVMSARMLEAEGAAARSQVPESAPSEEECRQKQSSLQDDNPSGSSAASAISTRHSMQQTGPQHRVDNQDTGVCSASNSPNQAIAGACNSDQEAGSSFTGIGGRSGAVEQHDGDADEGASNSSIHSRLLRAARAAKAGVSGKAQAAAVASLAAAGAGSAAAAAVQTAAFTVVCVYIDTFSWCLIHGRT